MYDNAISPAMRNTYLEDEYFDRFISSSTSKRPISGKIMKIIQGDFKLDIDNMYIGVFTVINVTDTTDKKPTNNPPNPPYINLSKLIYNIPYSLGGMSSDDNKAVCVDVYKKLLEKTKEYSFYSNNAAFQKLYNAQNNINIKKDFKIEVYEPHIKEFIALVQQNNPSSLIGSIESTDILRSFTFDKIVSYFDNDLNKAIYNKYKSIGLEYYNQDLEQVEDIRPPESVLTDKQLFNKLARKV
jgi:hypothetical protein